MISYHWDVGSTCYLVIRGDRHVLVRHLKDPDPIPLDCSNAPEADRLLRNHPEGILPPGLRFTRTGILETSGTMHIEYADESAVVVHAQDGIRAIHYTVIELPEQVM